MSARQLWVFRVSGGDPFKLQVKGSPPMRHDGGAESLLRTLCTQEQATQITEQMKAYGGRVQAYSSGESSEQKAERINILQVLGGRRSFPCARCPECAWFDPHLESLCGAGLAQGPGWETPVFQGALTNVKFKTDLDVCPLRENKVP